MFDYSIYADKRDRSFMPTSGYFTSFYQELPMYAEDVYIKNSFSSSLYKEINENMIGALKFGASAINGLQDDDVKISKRLNLSTSRLRGFQAGKVGPKDGMILGGNYTTVVNLEANFPNFFPEKSNADVGLFLDAGNVWGVDYSDTIDDSNKLKIYNRIKHELAVTGRDPYHLFFQKYYQKHLQTKINLLILD